LGQVRGDGFEERGVVGAGSGGGEGGGLVGAGVGDLDFGVGDGRVTGVEDVPLMPPRLVQLLRFL
jgi:hypothetical protein